MNPMIIVEFNNVSKRLETSSPDIDISGFVPEYNGWSGDWMIRPVIVPTKANPSSNNGELGRFEKRNRYKLKWYNYNTDDFLSLVRNQVSNAR